jgi:phosphosulfolactate phosphohydrolase-like enzyme
LGESGSHVAVRREEKLVEVDLVRFVVHSCEEGGTDISTHDYTRGPRELRDKRKMGKRAGGKHAFP